MTSKVLPDLLYEENGKFETNKGFSFDVSRRYIYTYNNTKDTLDIYFAKAVPPTSVPVAAASVPYERDYLFVSLSFAATPNGWLGTACHPCGQDLYNSRFLFAFRGVFLSSIRIEYTVKGPHKDYLSVTTLNR
jgi:hypothetical protein